MCVSGQEEFLLCLLAVFHLLLRVCHYHSVCVRLWRSLTWADLVVCTPPQVLKLKLFFMLVLPLLAAMPQQSIEVPLLDACAWHRAQQ